MVSSESAHIMLNKKAMYGRGGSTDVCDVDMKRLVYGFSKGRLGFGSFLRHEGLMPFVGLVGLMFAGRGSVHV